LEIDELVVRRVRVTEQLATPSTSDPGIVIDESKPTAATTLVEEAAASKRSAR